MNTGHKTVAALLALVAVLLAVNIVRGPRAAEAQGIGGDGEPYVVKYIHDAEGEDNTPLMYVVWSDGQINEHLGGCNPNFRRVAVPPVDHEAACVSAQIEKPLIGDVWTIVFADGRVDLHFPDETSCTPFGSGSAPLCLGDVDRDGDNDFDDLLYVLSGWGECTKSP